MKKKYTSKIKLLALKFAAKNNIFVMKDSFSGNYTKNITKNNKKPIMVNLGAGSFYHPMWINLDYSNEFYGNVQNKNMVSHDLSSMGRLPFEPDIVDVYYCSHVIEHLNNDCVSKIFQEVYRSLKPGGVFRLACPDIEYLYDDIKNGSGDVNLSIKPWGMQFNTLKESFLEQFCTILIHDENYRKNLLLRDDNFNENLQKLSMKSFLDLYLGILPNNANILMPHGHCNWFSFEKIELMLKNAGFNTVYKSEFCKSRFPELRAPTLFDGTVPEISLYVEAIK